MSRLVYILTLPRGMLAHETGESLEILSGGSRSLAHDRLSFSSAASAPSPPMIVVNNGFSIVQIARLLLARLWYCSVRADPTQFLMYAISVAQERAADRRAAGRRAAEVHTGLKRHACIRSREHTLAATACSTVYRTPMQMDILEAIETDGARKIQDGAARAAPSVEMLINDREINAEVAPPRRYGHCSGVLVVSVAATTAVIQILLLILLSAVDPRAALPPSPHSPPQLPPALPSRSPPM